ncbi:MAG: alpha/beta fold hydrolase [Gammaproteobacteria bacterium]|nr:MAG: alpha/beta fold hydrolase [Gammaproteobacteria bacterium]
MKQRVTFFSLLIYLALFSVPTAVYADTILLLHGYLGSSQEWQRSGIVGQLDSMGWKNAGVLNIEDDRVQSSKPSKQVPTNLRRLYSLELPSEQSIDKQAKRLDQYVKFVQHRHTDEQIILIGHSAGGIVARLYMVQNSQLNLSALITIASPHLGTKNAALAQTVSENVLVWVDSLPGVEKIYRSQGLFFDLSPNRTDNLIGWLNYQEHPQARYYSIVREDSKDHLQDFVVPSHSQDMNEVFALRGRSKTYQIKSLHGLSTKDGELLKTILIDLYTI